MSLILLYSTHVFLAWRVWVVWCGMAKAAWLEVHCSVRGTNATQQHCINLMSGWCSRWLNVRTDWISRFLVQVYHRVS